MRWLQGMRDAVRARSRNIVVIAADDPAVAAAARNSANHYVWALRAWRNRAYGPPGGKIGRTVVCRIPDVQVFLETAAQGDAA